MLQSYLQFYRLVSRYFDDETRARNLKVTCNLKYCLSNDVWHMYDRSIYDKSPVICTSPADGIYLMNKRFIVKLIVTGKEGNYKGRDINTRNTPSRSIYGARE